MLKSSIAALMLISLLAPAWAEEGEWALDKPESHPHGKAYTLRVALDEAKSHRGVVRYLQDSKMTQGSLRVDLAYQTHVRLLRALEDGTVEVGGEVDITRLVLDDDDLTERVRSGLTSAHVTGTVLEGRAVRTTDLHDLEGLRQLGKMFSSMPALLLPYLPKQQVQVGAVWDLPPQYVLWNVMQPMDGKPQGESFQVFEALEEKDGVQCARIRTAISVRTELPRGAGMLPQGPAVSQIKVEMRHWLGLDGYLRAAQTTARLLVTHAASKETINWTMKRSVEAGPAPVPEEPLGKSWKVFMGKLPFVVGYEAGMKEARFTGRAPMFFLTSHASAAGRAVGEKAFGNAEICKSLSGYTPILVDGETEEAFHKSRGKGNVLMDPTLIWEDLDGGTIFTMAGGIPDVPGVDAAEIATTMFEIPAGRAPEPRPSEGYKALVKVRDRLRAALKAKDRRTALAAIGEIREVALGVAIQKEAMAADLELGAHAAQVIEKAAALLRDKSTEAQGRTLLEALAAEFEGHPVADKAKELLAAEPAASK